MGFDNVAAGVASSGHGPTKESQSKGEGEQGGSGADKGQHDDGKQGSEGGKDGQAIIAVTATHGNESSFETIVSLGPDYIFVMDRDVAIGTEGAQLAQEI